MGRTKPFVRLLICAGLALLSSWAAAEAPIHLTIRCWDGDDNVPPVRNAAREFEEAYPNIKVKVEAVTSEYQEKLLAQVAAGVAPDVVHMDPANIQKFAVRNAFLPLDDFIKRSHYDISTYYKNYIDAHTFNGKLYVLPRDVAPISVVYYNKKLFDEAGIPYPDGSWTWDYQERPWLREKDFLWVMHQLTKVQDGRVVHWGYAPSWQDLLWEMFALSSGGRWADNYWHPTRIEFDNPKVMRAIQFSADLCNKMHWSPSPTEITSVLQSNARQIFTQQKVAMFQSGIWEIPGLRKDLVKGQPGYFDWDIAMAPAYKDGTHAFPTGGSGYAIMSSTKHPWEAWLLTKWMAGEPGMRQFAITGMAQPAIRWMARTEPWVPGPHTPPDQQIPRNRIIMDESAPHVVFGPYGTEYREVESLAMKPLGLVWEGRVKAADVLPESNRIAQARMDYLFTHKNLPPYNWGLGALVGVGLFGILAWWVYAPEVRKKRSPRQKRENRVAYLFVMPWILGLIMFTAGPMILSFLMSFSDWDIIQPARWRGLENFREAFVIDPTFWASLRVTLTYTIFAVPLGVAASLALAVLLNMKVRGIPLWRTCYYLPSIASGVAASLMWRRIFQPDGGLLNALIYGFDGKGNFLGLATLLHPLATSNGQVNWLGDDRLALSSLVMMSLWGAGGGMVLLLAGLQGVPAHYYEAATLDGAGSWCQFRRITIPLISPTLFFCLVTGFIGTFQVFTQALLMTDGGPNDATMFFGLHMWKSGFNALRMGFASALAWVMFFVVLVFTILQFRASRWVYYEAN